MTTVKEREQPHHPVYIWRSGDARPRMVKMTYFEEYGSFYAVEESILYSAPAFDVTPVKPDLENWGIVTDVNIEDSIDKSMWFFHINRFFGTNFNQDIHFGG